MHKSFTIAENRSVTSDKRFNYNSRQIFNLRKLRTKNLGDRCADVC
jgi:hypothetical protein